MRAVKQEHFSGCAIACVASILKLSYKNTIDSFEDGHERAKLRGFYCSEIIKALEINGLKYSLRYVKRRKNHIYPFASIVYLEKSSKHPVGHYLCNTPLGWMDSWINFPRLNAKAGFRKKLPGKPSYAIIPKEKPPEGGFSKVFLEDIQMQSPRK